MQFKSTLATLALASSAMAQGRPSNTSMCDYYTTALLKTNNATNQLTLLTLLVNTVVIGNYTKPDVGVKFPDVMVPGILAKGKVNDTDVNLAPYFNGGLASTNRGDKAVSVNFLDDGAAAPLMKNMPANGKSSNQYMLLTHLYQFFGTLLNCTQQGMPGYDMYGGNPSMFQVHKFMNLDHAQTTYFIQQVGLAAQSFGVTDDDVKAVGGALDMVFNYKCAPNVTLAPALGSQQQAICIASDCPTAPNATCAAYPTVMDPAVANSSLAMGQGNMSASVTATAPNGGAPAATNRPAGSGSMTMAATSTAGAAQMVGSGMAAGLGLLAFLF